mmetsp:Transcript_51792/g.110802  ORF Transcript_51792/g.110802 Transcript_51792/m.110802 type:complete len:249 (+) Transcript_51792:3-749(+)
MQLQWSTLADCYGRLPADLPSMRKVGKAGVCSKRRILAANASSREDPPPQVLEAHKLLKMWIFTHSPEVLAMRTLTPELTFPDVIASFDSTGKLQAIGERRIDRGHAEISFPLAVTRYALSYAVKGSPRAGAIKKAGTAMMGALLERWADEQGSSLSLYTLPASAFVRRYYIENGAVSACKEGSRHSEKDCAEMAERDENCGCNVRLCIPAQCPRYFQAGMCGPGFTTILGGWWQGCFSLFGKLQGSC